MANGQARPESAISENATARVSDQGMQNASVAAWSQIDSLPSKTSVVPDGRVAAALPSVELCGCGDDKQPTAHLQDLYKGGDKFTFAGKEIQDALDALRSGNTAEGKQELQDAINAINGGMGDIRNGVGGDFDLSQLPESNPLRRIGSGRQAIKHGRTSLYDALNDLNNGNCDMNEVLKKVEAGMVNVLGGNSNVQKATGLIERGESDHRPKHPKPEQPVEPQPQPDVPPAPKEDLPKLQHEHELHTATRHLGKADGSLSEAIGEIRRGDFSHAFLELTGSLKQIDSATKDLHYAFGGEVPGQEQFKDAKDDIAKALKRFQDRNYTEDTIKVIEKAITDLRSGRSVVHDASVVNVD